MIVINDGNSCLTWHIIWFVSFLVYICSTLYYRRLTKIGVEFDQGTGTATNAVPTKRASAVGIQQPHWPNQHNQLTGKRLPEFSAGWNLSQMWASEVSLLKGLS